MKHTCLRLALGLSVCLTIAGCGSTARFTYPDKMNALVNISQTPLNPQKVAVLPFEDFRNDENLVATMSLYYVPLSPFGYTECERPETGSRFVSISDFSFNPSEDLAKAAALSLKRSNLFSDAYFTFGGDRNNADLTLEGQIVSTYYKGRLLSYGCSIYSCYLWVLGAPSGTSLNRLTLRLALKDKTGRTLWERQVEGEDYITQWIYARRGQDVKLYAPLMRQAMNDAINDMAAKLKYNPAMLKPETQTQKSPQH